MANTKSAIKRTRKISRQTVVNKSRKSRFRSALKKMNIDLDRRVLAELAAEDSEAFSNLVSLAKENAS